MTINPVLASDLLPSAQRWLWDGYLACGAVTLIEGDPGASKSTVLLDLCARLTTGSPWPDGSSCERAGRVLIFNSEDGANTVRGRLDALEADLTRIDVEVSPLDLVSSWGEFEAYVRDQPHDAIVIDPMASFIARQEHLVMPLLAALAAETATSICLVRHLRKTAGRALYAGRGSISVVGSARAAFIIGGDPAVEDRSIMACTKMNLARKPVTLAFTIAERGGFAIPVWQGRSDHDADAVVTGSSHSRRERTEAAEFLVDLLQAGPVLAVEVRAAAEKAAVAYSTLRRAKSDLRVRSEKSTYAGGWTWALPLEPSKMLNVVEDAH